MPSRLGHGLYKKIDRLKNIFRCIYIIMSIILHRNTVSIIRKTNLHKGIPISCYKKPILIIILLSLMFSVSGIIITIIPVYYTI